MVGVNVGVSVSVGVGVACTGDVTGAVSVGVGVTGLVIGAITGAVTGAVIGPTPNADFNSTFWNCNVVIAKNEAVVANFPTVFTDIIGEVYQTIGFMSSTTG